MFSVYFRFLSLLFAIVVATTVWATPLHGPLHGVEKRSEINLSGDILPRSNTGSASIATFVQCKSSDQKKILEAIPVALVAFQDAWRFLEALGESPSSNSADLPKFTKFLGEYNQDRYKHVYKHFKVKAHSDLNGFTYTCAPKEECKDETGEIVAHSVPSQPGKIRICPKFLSSNLARRVHALVHETLHFDYKETPGALRPTSGANQGRYRTEHYGEAAVLSLAKSDPSYAVDNADSLTMFALSICSDPKLSSRFGGACKIL